MVLGHSWDHPNLNNIPPSVPLFEGAETAARFAATARPTSFNVLRPPFLSCQRADNGGAGRDGVRRHPEPDPRDRLGPGALRGADPRRDRNALRPGVAILLHDGPVDSPAGQATVDAVPMIIDAARASRVLLRHRRPDRPGGRGPAMCPPCAPIPAVTNPVPYLPLAYPGTAPAPLASTVPQPLKARREPLVRPCSSAAGPGRSRSRSPTRATIVDGRAAPPPSRRAVPAGLTRDRCTPARGGPARARRRSPAPAPTCSRRARLVSRRSRIGVQVASHGCAWC